MFQQRLDNKVDKRNKILKLIESMKVYEKYEEIISTDELLDV